MKNHFSKERMKKLLFIWFTAIFISPVYAQVTIKRLTEIPASIQYVGTPFDIQEIIDAEGTHIVFLSTVEAKEFGANGYKSEIYAYKYSYVDKSYKKKWAVKESNPSYLVSLSFINKLIVADVDKDGVAETIFSYQLVLDGLDPVTMKLMLHYKDKKYAIRGQIPQQDSDEYLRKIDPSFDQLPASVKAYAVKYWDQLASEMRQ